MLETSPTDVSAVSPLDIATPAPGNTDISPVSETTTTTPTSFVSIDAVPPSPQDIAALSSLVDVPAVSDMANPIDNALFSLLNEDTTKNAVEIDPTNSLVSESSIGTSEVSTVPAASEVAPSSSENFLSNLTSDAIPPVSPPVSSDNIGASTTQTVVETS